MCVALGRWASETDGCANAILGSAKKTDSFYSARGTGSQRSECTAIAHIGLQLELAPRQRLILRCPSLK